MLAEKISITLPLHLNQFAREYQETHHLKSKSEVVTLALKMLEKEHLEACYREMAEQTTTEDLGAWEGTAEDGLKHEDW